MSRAKRFEPIQQIVAAAANDLSRAMGEAARRVAELERQLEQLHKYRHEYVNSPAAGGISTDPVKLLNYRSFLERLSEALRQHVAKLESARADYDRRRAQWSEKRVEAESLGRAIERFRKQELHEAEQREQRESDEYAMRIALKRETP